MKKAFIMMSIVFAAFNSMTAFAGETDGFVKLRQYEENNKNTVLWKQEEQKVSVYNNDEFLYYLNIGGSTVNTDVFSFQLDYNANINDGFTYLKQDTLDYISKTSNCPKTYSENGKYEVVEEKYISDDGNICVSYPQIKNYKGELIADYMNQSIFNMAEKYINSHIYKSINIDYTLQKCSDDLISILFTGEASVEPYLGTVNIADSITLDFKTSNEFTIENNISDIDKLKSILQDNSIRKLEYEKLNFYINEDKIIFYYKPLDDSKNLCDAVALNLSDIEDILTFSNMERPAS